MPCSNIAFPGTANLRWWYYHVNHLFKTVAKQNPSSKIQTKEENPEQIQKPKFERLMFCILSLFRA